MGKRSASGLSLGQKLRSILGAKNTSNRSAQLRRAVSRVELAQPLERRMLLSSTASLVTLDWQGHTTQAYASQYVAETAHTKNFQSLAAKEGFINVTSLGGEGYYSFDSNLPVTALERLPSTHPLALEELSPNTTIHAATTTTDDPELPNQYYLSNTGQVEPYDYNGDGVVTPYNSVEDPTPPSTILFPSPPYPNENKVGTPGDDIDVENAWDTTTGSKSVVIAVLDTGIDLTHPDLIPNIWTNPLDTAANNDDGDGFPDDVNGWNFIDDDNDVTDDNGHGTAVAGVIGAAGNNGLGVSGVNWNVSILPVKVLDETGSGTAASIIDGINYCITLKSLGINIVAINESINDLSFPQNFFASNAIAEANKAGILDVVAAGNDGDGDTASTEGENLDGIPSAVPAKNGLTQSNVITVAAVDNQFQLAEFSNYGADTVNLAAPGVDIYTTAPTYDNPLSDTIAAAYPDIPQFTENYGYLSGTSLAAPVVTGIIGLESAANPLASPAQLKSALLKGTTYDPALAAGNGLPAKVATSGVANAYNAVQNILNDYVGTNTARQGNWVGVYGSGGAYVAGESTTFPSFVTVDQTGGSPVILDNATNNLAGLQQTSNPSQRISAYEAAGSTETINLNFTDGNVHQTELYIADLDRKKRVETVQLIDNATGDVLDSETISSFTKGEYLIYDLRGNVSLNIINNSGPSAVYSGLFFDTPPAAPTTFVSSDTSTTGQNWRNEYGSQGAIVVGNQTQLPSYVNFFSVVGETNTVLKPTTKAPAALQKITDANSGIEAYWSTTTSMDLNLQTDDGLAHTVTLYLADYDKKQRQERIEVISSATGSILDTQDISSFTKGEFVSFQITGDVTFRIFDTAGPSAVVSGIFFDAPYGEKVHYEGTDTTTGGNWQTSLYGLNTAYIVGDNFPSVDDVLNPAIVATGATEDVLADPSSSTTALLRVTTPSSTLVNNRVAAYIFTTTAMTIAYNPGDEYVHTVALYFADYGNQHRQENVTLYNPATLQPETSQLVSNFSKGKYLVFDVSGQVLITITNGGYPNAVLSGIFTN